MNTEGSTGSSNPGDSPRELPISTESPGSGDKSGASGAIVDSVLLIAVVPAFFCAISFAYEAGYFRYFKVPTTLASIEPQTMFSTIATVGLICVGLLFLVLDLLAPWRPKGPIERAILQILIYALFIATYGLVSSDPNWWRWTIAVLLLMSLWRFGLPLVFRDRQGLPYSKRLALFLESAVSLHGTDAMVARFLDRWFGTHARPLLLTAILLIATSYSLGRNAGQTQRDFMVMSLDESDSRKVLLLRAYKEMVIGLVVARIDNGPWTVEGFRLFPAGATEIGSVRWMALGPLAVGH